MARKRLGEILLERELINQEQLNLALGYQRQWGHRLGSALVAKGFISEGTLVKVLGEIMGLRVIDLSRTTFDPEAFKMVAIDICDNNELIPISIRKTRSSRVLLVAMADPLNVAIIDEIEFTSGVKVQPFLTTISSIQRAIQKYYRGGDVRIHPLSFEFGPMPDTGRMHLVRAGGNVETVDTSTYSGQAKQKVMNLYEEVSAAASTGESSPSLPVAPPVIDSPPPATGFTNPGSYLPQNVQATELETLQKLEKYFWALMRVMARKGVISKEEFMKELK